MITQNQLEKNNRSNQFFTNHQKVNKFIGLLLSRMRIKNGRLPRILILSNADYLQKIENQAYFDKMTTIFKKVMGKQAISKSSL
jgi:hypothetical protein